METAEYCVSRVLLTPSALEQLLPWLTQTPVVTVYRVNLLKTTVDAFQRRVETLLAEKFEIPPKTFTIYGLPEVLCIGTTIALIPEKDDSLKQVIVDLGCGAALLRGAHVYAPGVLGMEAGAQLDEQVQVYCDLTGKCLKGTSTRYESADKYFIGVGRVRKQRHQLYPPQVDHNVAMGVAVEMEATITRVPPLGNLSSCEALLQNLPSIVAVHVLNPKPGERILDMCSSPGNKTTHIAEFISDDGLIIALDKSERKIARVQEKIWNNALTSIFPYVYDSTKALAEEGAGNDLADPNNYEPPYAANTFDRVLLDAPCTCLGNRPLLGSSLTAAMFPSFPKIQKQLIANAVDLLKPQGVLVYCTCSITEEENEGVVAWVLSKFPNLCLVDAVPKFGGIGLANAGLTSEQRPLVQRFGPPAYNFDKTIDTIGFFIAKFIKTN